MPQLRMLRSPMAPADYADHVGTWSVGGIYDVSAEDVARKRSDFPGCFELVEPPITSPPQHTAVTRPPQARTRGR